jgi:hypothetical protein
MSTQETSERSEVAETVDALLTHTGQSLTRQYAVADALDQKAVGILAAAGAFIAITAIGLVSESPPAAATALVIAAGAVWVFVTAITLAQLWTRRYQTCLAPDRWEDRRFYDPDAVKSQLLDECAAAYNANRQLNLDKARAVRWAIKGAAIETALVLAAIIVGLAG